MKAVRFLTETLAWLQIALSPAILVAAVGFIVSIYLRDFRLFWAFVAIGTVVGVVLATRIAKRNGAANFMSRHNASPDLDDKT